MHMTRRGFMQTILAAGVAPAIVRATSIMPGIGLIIPDTAIILPTQEIFVPQMDTGARIFTAAFDSLAYLEAKAEGLQEIRRYPAGYGAHRVENVEFVLPRTR